MIYQLQVLYLIQRLSFRRTCTPIKDDTPIAISLPKRSGAVAEICNPLPIRNINSDIITITPTNPISSANIANMKSFCGSGI